MKKLIIILSIISLILPINTYALSTTSSIIVKDMNSNRVFYNKNEKDVRLIASTTKIMTAILAIENGNLEDIVKVDENILQMYGSNIYIEVGENILLLDLIYGLMLRSGNDAAVTIAKHIDKTEEGFVKLMNKKAQELGMKNTTFSNPTGLDDDTKNYSTAEDLAILYSYAYKNKTFREVVKTKRYVTTSNTKTYDWYNRNKILSLYEKATGGKTGYTPDAKRVLVTSASNNDLSLVAASFNSIYDYDLHIKLYEEIFNKYKNYLILDKDNFVYQNNLKNKKLYIKNSFSYPLTEEEYNNLKIDLTIDKEKKSNKVGTVSVYLENNLIKKENIYEKTTKKKTIWTKISAFFKNIL